MRRWRWLWVVLALASLPLVAWGRELLQGDNCTIPADVVVTESLFVLCQTLQVEGRVQGNLIGLAWRTHITGRIEGGLYLAGGALTLHGQLDGTLHFGGLLLDIVPATEASPPRLGGNLFSATLTTHIADTVRLPGSAVVLSYQLLLDGRIARELNFWGSHFSLGGQVGGDVFASVGDPKNSSDSLRTILLPLGFDVELKPPGLVLKAGSLIQGDLEYYGPAAGELHGRVARETRYVTAAPPPVALQELATWRVYAEQALSEAATLGLVGGLALLFLPRSALRPLTQMRVRPFASFSAGLLAFILSFPLLLILVLLSLLLVLALLAIGLDGVAVPVALALFVLNAMLGGVFYFLAIFGGRMLVAWALGRVLLRWLWRGYTVHPRAPLYSLLLGVGLFGLLTAIPNVGWIPNALALFIGLGAILTVFMGYLRRLREAPPSAAPAEAPPAPPVLVLAEAPAPAIELAAAPAPPALPQGAPLGLAALPAGFDPTFFDD